MTKNHVSPVPLRCIFTIMCLMGNTLNLWAANAAQEIYDRAQETMKKSSYRTTEREKSGKLLTYSYRYNANDGSSFSRFETSPESTISIRNADGSFSLTPTTKTAVKDTDPLPGPDTRDTYAAYGMTEGSYQNMPCYIVKKTLRPRQELYSEFLSRQSGDREADEEELQNRFKELYSSKTVYYIGQSNFFIYAQVEYDRKNKLVQEISYDTVEFNPDLPDRLFKIPSGYKVRHPDDDREWLLETAAAHKNEIIEKRAIRNAGPSWQEQLGRFADVHFSAIMSFLSYFCLAIAIVLLTIVGTYKWKRRKGY